MNELSQTVSSILSPNFDDLCNWVIDTGLCTHCGTCAAACPVEAIRMTDLFGECVPELVGACKECGLCLAVCPGKSVDFQELLAGSQELEHHPMLGSFRQICVGHATDDRLRQQGASGGMVTGILLQLLEKGNIDGAVVLGFSQEKPWLPEVKLATDRSGIIKAAQSKYCIYPQNIALRMVRESCVKSLAYVALPCQVHGLRKAMKERVAGTEKIKYLVGLYCGNNLWYGATLSLFKRFGFKQFDSIVRVAYRDGAHPGSFVVEDWNRKKHSIDKFTLNYLSFFYTPMRCLLCIDQANEHADISVGDAWSEPYSETGTKGRSVVIVRRPDIVTLLEAGEQENRYHLDPITQEAAILMHANVLDNKKVGALARMGILRRCGKEVPSYDLEGRSISIKRYALELANLLLLSICSGHLPRMAVSKVPLTILGPLLKYTRAVWRRKAARSYSRY